MTSELNEASLAAPWGFLPQWFACERCAWSYLIPAGSSPAHCPHCFNASLARVDTAGATEAGTWPLAYPPELYLPFTLSDAQLAQGIQSFTRGIPFPPADLLPQKLSSRLQRIYLPMWLVDAEVQATWQAETGFDYQVVSHQDRYDDNRGGWTSQEVTEGRVRWEPRLGRLNRTYSNVPAPALEDEPGLRHSLGDWALSPAQAYRPDAAQGVMVRLADRSPQDAWPEAVPVIQAAAGEECRRAAKADHLRDFRWTPEFCSQNWTVLLRPVLSTYYLDDEGVPQRVLIHGQTGQVSGVRRASPKRGQRAALWILGAALGIFLVSLLLAAAALLFPPLLPFVGVGLLAALLAALGAAIPVITVWQFNRQQVSGP